MLDADGRRRGEVIQTIGVRNSPDLIHSGPKILALIDNRRLERECFVRSMEQLRPEMNVLGYASANAFVEAAADTPVASIILFYLGDQHPAEPSVRSEMETLLRSEERSPIVMLAASEDIDLMIAALDAGAVGYVPSSLGIDVIIESVKLAALGGVVLRVNSLTKLRESCAKGAEIQTDFEGFTDRQTVVAEALRQGKPNKVIAHELDMCESTVKVHIRKIMSKLNASNRTEAAFKLNSFSQHHH